MKCCREKKLKPAPLQQDHRSEQGWSPVEGDAGGSWRGCFKRQWEAAQLLQWPSLKGIKRSEIPFIHLQYLFPGFYQGCSFPGELFLCCWSMRGEAQASRVEGLQAWLRWVSAWNPAVQLRQGWGVLALIRETIRNFLHFLLRAVFVCQTRALPSCVTLWQSRSLLCEKPLLLIIQKRVPLPMFHAALPSSPAILYAAW